MHFGNLDVDKLRREGTDGLLSLCDGLLTEIAWRLKNSPAKFDPDAYGDNHKALCEAVIKAFAEQKKLRENRDNAKNLLGPDAIATCTRWVNQSHGLDPVSRCYWTCGASVPSHVRTLILPPGNGLRLARDLKRVLDGVTFDQILLPRGNRLMGADEGPDVITYHNNEGHLYYPDNEHRYPTEAELTEAIHAPKLRKKNHRVTTIPVNDDGGTIVFKSAFGTDPYRDALGGTILMVSDPLTLHFMAGQLLTAVHPLGLDVYDLYIQGWDDRPLATTDSYDPETTQDPITAVGMVLRGILQIDKAFGMQLHS